MLFIQNSVYQRLSQALLGDNARTSADLHGMYTYSTQNDKQRHLLYEERVATAVPRHALGKVATIPRHPLMPSVLPPVRVEGYAVLARRVDTDAVIREASCWMQVEDEEEGGPFKGNDLVVLVLCRDPRLH